MITDGTYPLVLKLDGLAAGKGVVIGRTLAEAEAFGKRVFVDYVFGKQAQRIVLEQFIKGKELSYVGLCDGRSFVPLASAVDYKRAGDANTGENTGGMGALSPSPYCSPELEKKIRERITTKLLTQLEREGIEYCGALYLGLMITETGDPYVLEFNARFGDPETQAVLPRLETDFLTALELTARGRLSEMQPLKWKPESSVYVVGSAEGYPGKATAGDPIEGLENIDPQTMVFFAGVGEQSEALVTAGGRVLGVGALAGDVDEAKDRVYRTLKAIHWRGMHYRTDIGTLEVD